MAIKKIQIRPEGTNDYADVLHPETSVDMVVGLDRYGVASGTNTYTVTIPNTPALTTGLRVTVKFTNANTGASTLNINGLGAKSIVKAGGAALSSGNIKAGGVYTLVYDGLVFQLQGEGGEYGNVTPNDVIKGITFGTEEGLKTGTLELTGNATAAYVLSGKTFYSTNPKSKLTGSMTNRGAVTSTITTQGGSYTIPAGYHNGSGKVTANFANLVPENIKQGVNIGGVVGSYSGYEYPFRLTSNSTGPGYFTEIFSNNTRFPTTSDKVVIKFTPSLSGQVRIEARYGYEIWSNYTNKDVGSITMTFKEDGTTKFTKTYNLLTTGIYSSINEYSVVNVSKGKTYELTVQISKAPVWTQERKQFDIQATVIYDISTLTYSEIQSLVTRL